MVFRRRDRLKPLDRLKALIWPRGGWNRALRYIWTRMTRLPDPPHRIARGIFAGIFVSFTPLFGVHLGVGAVLAWVMRGNMLAALLATLVGNPLTFPLIAVGAMELGHLILGNMADAPPVRHILLAFAEAGAEFWANVVAMFTAAPTGWHKLGAFWRDFFLPYLMGGTVLGLICGLAGYFASLPVIGAYHRMRETRRAERALQRAGRHLTATPDDRL